ncbi:MAG: hypothetical protein HYT83_02125 [Candidatus Levybacteria bacterium]|nr:hypothetical protein [Candidatus Levybacteria bacterium]
MKKFILPIILVVFIFLLSPHVTYAGTDAECRPIFDQDMKKCTENFNACIHLCGEETKKPDGDTYFNSGEVYSRCTKREQCSEKSSDCSAKALEDFWACRKSDKKPDIARLKKEPEVSSNESWLTNAQQVNDWIISNGLDLNIEKIETGAQLERTPNITQEDKEAAKKAGAKNKFYLGMSFSETGLIKLPGSSEFIKIDKARLWDFPLGSTIKAIDEPVKLFSSDGTVIIITPGSEATLPETGPINILNGTVELEGQHDASTEFIDLFIIGTHYWITHEPTKETIVGVYQGQVKVKTKDGKVMTVEPQDGKPGVVVVAQKLSLAKLAMFGLVLAVAIGTVVLILKKKK